MELFCELHLRTFLPNQLILGILCILQGDRVIQTLELSYHDGLIYYQFLPIIYRTRAWHNRVRAEENFNQTMMRLYLLKYNFVTLFASSCPMGLTKALPRVISTSLISVNQGKLLCLIRFCSSSTLQGNLSQGRETPSMYTAQS